MEEVIVDSMDNVKHKISSKRKRVYIIIHQQLISLIKFFFMRITCRIHRYFSSELQSQLTSLKETNCILSNQTTESTHTEIIKDKIDESKHVNAETAKSLLNTTHYHSMLLKKIEQITIHQEYLEEFIVKSFWKTQDLLRDEIERSRIIDCIICAYSNKAESFKIINDTCQFGGGKLIRYTCPVCECLFGPMKYLDMDEHFVSTDYALLYSRYSEQDSTKNEISAFYSLNPIRAPEGLYLNWGTGGKWSKTIHELRQGGFDVWGYEPCIKHSSEFVVNNKNEISNKFDGIFSNNVIEHFRNPIDEFKYFHSILKDDGKMVHQTACYEYKHGNTRFHTLFLLGKSPEILAERTGFHAKKIASNPDTISWLFEKV